jgi:hypothetical protein
MTKQNVEKIKEAALLLKLIAIPLGLVFALIFGIYQWVAYNAKREYKGVVTYTGYEENKGYYKYSDHPVYYVILKIDSIEKSIRVNVTFPCWSIMKKGARASFDLSRNELETYGNGDNPILK